MDGLSKRDIIKDVEDVEVGLLLDGIYQHYGYDFRNYSRAHMKRRVMHKMGKENIQSVSMLQHRVLHDVAYFRTLLPEFSINVTEMFRDPEVFSFLRKEVMPYLASFPRLKIWHAGCSSGEEVYSMAILLKEAGLYDRTTIYATDFNDAILKKASEGIYPIEAVKEHTRNYIAAGGTEAFSDYYVAKYDSVIMDKSLKENISFLNHNLVTDGVFGQMDFIICRNVLIYFDRKLQNRVLNLFDDSLVPSGIICLGTKETIDYSEVKKHFKPMDGAMRIYKKKSHIR